MRLYRKSKGRSLIIKMKQIAFVKYKIYIHDLYEQTHILVSFTLILSFSTIFYISANKVEQVVM